MGRVACPLVQRALTTRNSTPPLPRRHARPRSCRWAAAKRSQGAGPVPCPFCRGAWVNPDAPAAAAGGGGGAAAAGAGVSYSRDGYANFAAVAGLSTRRDTSTYHRPPERYLRGGGRKRGRGRWGYLQYGDYDDDGGDFDEDDYDGDDY